MLWCIFQNIYDMPNISKLHLSGEKYSHLLLVCTLGIILSVIFSKILFITFSISQTAAERGQRTRQEGLVVLLMTLLGLRVIVLSWWVQQPVQLEQLEYRPLEIYRVIGLLGLMGCNQLVNNNKLPTWNASCETSDC